MGSIFWFISTIIFIVIELVSTALLSIWFACAAFIVFILSYFIENKLIEWIIFSILSIIFLIITKPIYNKFYKKKVEKTNVYSLVGKKFILNEKITKTSLGKIKINGEYWNATSDDEIDSGEQVIVDEIVGTKLIVRKCD